MEIKKTDIVQITKEDFKKLFEHCDRLTAQEMKFKYSKAFEPEYRECYLMTNAPNCANELPSLGAEVDTGNWRIFDGGDSFYVVHKDLEIAFRFIKIGDSDNWTYHGTEILKYLKERK